MSHFKGATDTMGHRIIAGEEEFQKTKGDPASWVKATQAQVDAHKSVYDFLRSPLGIVQSRQTETKAGELPAGQYWTEKEAIAAAIFSGLKGSQPIGSPEVGVYGWSTSEYRTYVKAGRWSFEEAANPIVDVSVERFTYRIEPATGNLIRLSNTDPNRKDIVSSAPDKPKKGSKKIGDAVPTGFGYSLQLWEHTDEFGNSSRYQVKVKDPDDREIGDADIDLGEGRGDFIYLGDGKYEHVPDAKTPFTLDPTAGAGDIVPLDDLNGSLVRISENQYQFVRDTYEPGVKEHTDSQGNVRQFSQSASGIWTELAPRFDADVIEKGGREFLQQTTGALSELDPRYDPSIEEIDGMTLLQQRGGQIGQLTPATMDQIITKALIDGEYDKAFAFQDFRDRPSAIETFQTALAFARSPADQRIISSIARGITPVQPPPEGTIQRVGPQPDFLIEAYQDFQRRTQAGRAPTGEEIAGASEEPTLQAQLEAIRSKDRREEEKHQLFMAGETGKQDRAQTLFDTKQETAAATTTTAATTTAAAAAAAGDAGDTDVSAPDADVGRMKNQPGTTAMVSPIDGKIHNIDNSAVELFLSGGQWKKATEEDLNLELQQEADATTLIEQQRVEAETQRNLAEEQRLADVKVRVDDYQAALAAGFDPADFNMISGRMVEAHKASIVEAEEQQAEEVRTTERSRIETALEDIGRGYTYPAEGLVSDPKAVGAGGGMPPMSQLARPDEPGQTLAGYARGTTFADIEKALGLEPRAGGGTVQPGEITVVGEKGPEIAMMPPGTHILPLGKATKNDIRAAQSTGRAYQTGGIVFEDLPPGLQQIWRGRPITPPRGYLLQQGGLPLPSPQALQNLAPGTRESFMGMAGDIGISPAEFRQELQTATPRGTRLPTSRMLPLGRRGVR